MCPQKESTLTARAAFFDLMPPQSLLQPPITPAFKISFCQRSEAYEHVEREGMVSKGLESSVSEHVRGQALGASERTRGTMHSDWRGAEGNGCANCKRGGGQARRQARRGREGHAGRKGRLTIKMFKPCSVNWMHGLQSAAGSAELTWRTARSPEKPGLADAHAATQRRVRVRSTAIVEGMFGGERLWEDSGRGVRSSER